MTIVATLTPALDAIDWDPTQPVTLQLDSSVTAAFSLFSLGIASAIVGNVGQVPAVIINGTAQAGWDVTAALSMGGLRLTVTFMPTGGWAPGTNYGVAAPPSPQDTYPLGDETPFQLQQYFFQFEGYTAQPGHRFVTAAVSAPPVITTTTLPGGVVGTPYAETVEADDGVAPLVWDLSAGSLPPGLTIDEDTGEISGTPTTAGVYAFTARVTDATPDSDTQALSITIAPSLAITTTALADATMDASYSATVEATGGVAPRTFALAPGSDPMPPGLTLGTDGTITGTPTTPGRYRVVVRVTDSA